MFSLILKNAQFLFLIPPTIFIPNFEVPTHCPSPGHSTTLRPPKHLELLLLLERQVVGIPPCVATAKRGFHREKCRHRLLCRNKTRQPFRPWHYLDSLKPKRLIFLPTMFFGGTSGTAATWHPFLGGWTTTLRNRGKVRALFFSFIPTEFHTLICWCLARIILFLGNQLWFFNDEL